jgi:hypothetical protein
VKFAYIVCDVSVDPSPVFYRSCEEFEPPGNPDAPSIGTMVCQWIESIDEGHVELDRGCMCWTRGPRAPAVRNRLVD